MSTAINKDSMEIRISVHGPEYKVKPRWWVYDIPTAEIATNLPIGVSKKYWKEEFFR